MSQITGNVVDNFREIFDRGRHWDGKQSVRFLYHMPYLGSVPQETLTRMLRPDWEKLY